MSIDVRDTAAVEKKLWEELEHSRFGMLGATRGPDDRFAPMTAFGEPESGTIWFYTRVDTELAMAAEQGTPACLIFMSKDQSLQASLRGTLHTTFDALHRDKYWSSMVSAWYPEGKDDPSLTLLRLNCAEADVWISDAGTLKFGWEIAKANLTGTIPDVGGHVRISF